MSGLTISPSLVGAQAGPLRQAVDARWLMAYAAAARAHDAPFFDTTRPAGPVVHPLFPVCYEWPLLAGIRDSMLGPAVAPYGVHASHHVAHHRPLRAGDELAVTARVTAVTARRAGALVMVRLETVDGAGAPVTTTDYGSLYRGVGVAGTHPAPAGAPPARATPAPHWTAAVDVAYHDAHVYTECARIWNPIHTDVAVARAAGLAGPILHGTATLAYAVSLVVARELGGDPAAARAVAGRFTGMVPLPSTFTVRLLAREPGGLAFDAVGPAGQPVLTEGVIRT